MEKPVIPQGRKSAPRQAPEALLLFLLVISVLLTLASFLLAHHPAASLLVPISETEARTGH